MKAMKRWLSSPTLHFAAIGGLLFAVESTWSQGQPPAGSETLVISAAHVEQLRQSWQARMGRPPDDAALAGLVQAEIDDEVLFRTARALDLHRVDPIVRRRLVRNLRFVGEGEADERSDDELFAQAIALGMDRTDTVVRRRLVQKMRLLARAGVAEPTAEEIAAYRARHAALYTIPASVRISQIYLSRDRRGQATAGDASRLLQSLRDDAVPPERAHEFGDPFLLRHHVPLRSQRELESSFGPEFAREAFALEPGAWQGPVASSYGQHLVWVHERVAARPATPASVERRVRDDLVEERARAAIDREIRSLRSRYHVVVEGAPS
jgi:hypothetical protein